MAGFDKVTNGLIINYMTLRRLIGWMGVCLPFVVYLGNWVIFTHHVTACLLPSTRLSRFCHVEMGVVSSRFWGRRRG